MKTRTLRARTITFRYLWRIGEEGQSFDQSPIRLTMTKSPRAFYRDPGGPVVFTDSSERWREMELSEALNIILPIYRHDDRHPLIAKLNALRVQAEEEKRAATWR